MKLLSWLINRHIHYWENTTIPHFDVFRNGKFLYECRSCRKRKYFSSDPVNYISPPATAERKK